MKGAKGPSISSRIERLVSELFLARQTNPESQNDVELELRLKASATRGYYDFKQNGQTLRKFAWFAGKVNGRGWHTYKGPNEVTLINGSTVRLGKGTYQVIGTAPARVVESGAGFRNAAIGNFHSSAPFGKTITDTMGVHADEDSSEYQAGLKGGAAANTALSVASFGVGGGGSLADDAVNLVDDAAHSAANALRLNKSLASAEQVGEAGTIMAGAGGRVPFRGAARVASEYGGTPSEWVKVSSSSYTTRDGVRFETHWVQNVRTGQRVEFKTKFTN